MRLPAGVLGVFDALLEKTAKVSEMRASDFDAIVVVGGTIPDICLPKSRRASGALLEVMNRPSTWSI
jgi:hypothetical protein